jgi:predicted HAD superfamily Cof-like phosphohydrolase
MHVKFAEFDDEKKLKFLQFRADFLQEELNELKDNMNNPEEIVDALIDLCVVAIGTLDAYGIDSHRAWDEVLRANMAKRVGVKPGRPNPLNMPDLMKPEGWEAPSHAGNHGTLTK